MNFARFKPRPGRCAKFVLGLFGYLFLMALLFVPCTTTTSSLRTDPHSQVVIRTTHPGILHLPAPIPVDEIPSPRRETVRARLFQWSAFMVIIAVLGSSITRFFAACSGGLAAAGDRAGRRRPGPPATPPLPFPCSLS